jgi:hypothetical protein
MRSGSPASGAEQQKASIRNCTHCHTLERVARSRYDVDKLTTVIERMATYPQLSFLQMIQKLVPPGSAVVKSRSSSAAKDGGGRHLST